MIGASHGAFSHLQTPPTKVASKIAKHPQAVEDVRGGGGHNDYGPATAEVAPSVFNLVNNVAGAGLLTLSAAMSKGTGWVPALLICATLGTISSHSFNLIGESCRLTGEMDFKGLWTKTIGGSTTYVVDAIIALMCSAASIIYSGVLGDVSTELLAAVGIPSSRSKNILLITATVLFPLSLLRNLSALAFTSILGFASIIYTVLFISYRAYDGTYGIGAEVGKFIVDDVIVKPSFERTSMWGFDFTSLVLCSNLGLAFIAHYNAPVYYREMKDKKNFKKMVSIAFAILTLIYAATMANGMKTFGDVCQGNIILNYHPKDVLSTLGRFATFFSILFGFPLTFCGIREGMQGIATRFNWTSVLENRTALIVALLAFVTYIAITVTDISFIVGITGAAMGSMIVYILPATIYAKSVALAYGKASPEYKSARKNYILVPFGLALGLFGVGMTIAESKSS